MIRIYGKDDCGYCVMAQAICKNNEYEYTYLSLGKDYEKDFVVENFPTARTFPVVVIDNEYIGGFQELNAWHKNNKGK